MTFNPIYLLRNDLPPAEWPRVWRLQKALQEVSGFEVRILEVASQVLDFSEAVGGLTTISLDKRFTGTYDFRVSRLFGSYADGDAQTRPEMLVSGTLESLDEQASKILTVGNVLVDDDTASGYTINQVSQFLGSELVTSVEFMNSNRNFVDIVDASDFISPEKYEGGLVVALKGSSETLLRAGYLTPHVNLETRASICNSSKEFIKAAVR